MTNKTCGECKHFSCSDEGQCMDDKWTFCDSDACNKFQSKVITNGDVIRQGGDKSLLAYRSNAACYYCSFRDTESCKSDFSNCKDGQLAWLNAPAESEGKDDI